jgi:peptidoglycan/xylan/chitin deacetylase (PgdA/CDA1 family)
MRLKTLLTAALAILTTTITAFAEKDNTMRVTMMIDDGPSEYTAQVLDILKEEGIHANFDLIGSNVEKYPDLARRILAEGHTVNDHSYRHGSPSKMTDEELRADMKGGYEAILKATGKAPLAYWPPYIEYDARMDANLKELGLIMYKFPVVVSGEVWDRPQTGTEIRDRTLAGVQDGCVLLFHEWRQDTLETFQETLKELKKRGCVFVSYEELVAFDESLKQ